uniref:Trithorax group protein osa-like n=1 Tax=Takifugu rubripes TaxID=31033 RepID=A0A3B5KER6_TAKRU
MRGPLLFPSLSLTVLLTSCVLAQDLVQIQFQTDPLVAQTGSEVVFTVLTVSQVLSMTWQYQGQTLGVWAGGTSVINPVDQFLGRLSISATQLRIVGTRLQDKGNYSVQVIPSATTGLDPNSKSVQLRVFDAVAGIGLLVPTVAAEGRNVSLRCTWTAGTEITVQWGKGGATISPDARITITGDSLVITPAQRSDAGEYTCTASNAISAQTATRSITVYYGPDTPVLTKDTPKDCVGGGDVLLGQTVRLTCISDSLPPALFSWQRDGQPVVSNQPDSGVLRIQTVSTDESGQYVCTARNSITGGTSEQETNLAIVGTCLDGGEVAGIVIGCFLLLILILILFILLWRRRNRGRRRRAQEVQKNNPPLRPTPPQPQTTGARIVDQGPQITHARNYENLYTSPQRDRSNPQALRNGQHNSNTHRQTDHTHTNGVSHASIRNNNNPYPHNGIDNPAFTRADDQNVNTNVQQQNPNILIQSGPAQGGGQLPAVHVSLNTPSQTAQQNNGAQVPTIHVNLNSFSANGHQTQQESSFPFNSASNNNASQAPENLTHVGRSNPAVQNWLSYQNDDRFNGHREAAQAGLIPTGYTHRVTTLQRNANTQTYLQDSEPRRTSGRISSRENTPASLSPQQMPWDLLHGTPAYPGGTARQGQTSPESSSNTTDYTPRPPIREVQNRPLSQSESAPRRRAPARNGPAPTERLTRSRSADLIPNSRSATEIQNADYTRRSPPAQQGIRGLITTLIASRHESTNDNSPQTRPRSSQEVSVGHSVVSQGHTSQQGRDAPRGSDTRALADPNHLPQAHVAPQRRALPSQNPAQDKGAEAQPVANGAKQPRQGGAAPGPTSASQANPSNLTQAALREHSHRTETFPNRRQQTQAALLHPGPQTQAPPPAAGVPHPPTPPPAIALAQFQSLPKKHVQHRSPGRGPQPPRPPVNVPVAQRPHQTQQRHNGRQHHATVPGQMPHRHGHAHAHGHRPTTHTTHPRQVSSPSQIITS